VYNALSYTWGAPLRADAADVAKFERLVDSFQNAISYSIASGQPLDLSIYEQCQRETALLTGEWSTHTSESSPFVRSLPLAVMDQTLSIGVNLYLALEQLRVALHCNLLPLDRRATYEKAYRGRSTL
jgi:hypothetical protein